MKGSGIFRGMTKSVSNLFRRTQHYDDPVFDKQHVRAHKSTKIAGKVRRCRLPRPPCVPGTITYRDALVKHLGYDRRAADKMLRDWREADDKLLAMSLLPKL